MRPLVVPAARPTYLHVLRGLCLEDLWRGAETWAVNSGVLLGHVCNALRGRALAQFLETHRATSDCIRIWLGGHCQSLRGGMDIRCFVRLCCLFRAPVLSSGVTRHARELVVDRSRARELSLFVFTYLYLGNFGVYGGLCLGSRSLRLNIGNLWLIASASKPELTAILWRQTRVYSCFSRLG